MRLIQFLARVIGWLVSLVTLVFSLLAILPVLKQLLHNTVLSALLTLLTAVPLAIAVQIPFWNVNQAVRKAFFGLGVQSSNTNRPLILSVLVQREAFCKLMSRYLIYLPMLRGGLGGYKIATGTQVVHRRKSSTCYKK